MDQALKDALASEPISVNLVPITLPLDEVPSAVAGQDGSGLMMALEGRSLPARFHPLAQLFPMIEGEAFAALVEDVRVNGVRRPIALFEGMILDGRNRYLAAREAGVGYPVVDFTGDDPVAFVVSENIHRRHLTESQRAMVAAKIAKLPPHRPTGNSADMRTSPTAAEAASQLNVSTRMVESARTVVRDGTPALVQMVETDKASVSAAAEVAKLPEAVQVEIVAEGPEAVRDAAKALRDDATIYEKFKAGDPETLAGVRAQIMDAVTNPAPRPRASRANPLHEANPAFDAANRVIGGCVAITETLEAKGERFVIQGFLDAAMRARSIAKFTAARDALNRLLETIDAA